MYEYLAVLPDEEDRILIVDALELGCGVFLTMDYRTVLSHQELVGKLGIRVLRPPRISCGNGVSTPGLSLSPHRIYLVDPILRGALR